MTDKNYRDVDDLHVYACHKCGRQFDTINEVVRHENQPHHPSIRGGY